MSFVHNPVLNIIVVGFHHKRGCQVEHCYPELIPGRPSELPAAWRYLPALALPDGSHNYLSDTIFFSLPGLSNPDQTVYGISCFRQIPVEQVAQKTEDMTRSSVQKSVCIICCAPLYGRLAIKMELVVRAWFLQGDFSNTKLLEDAFKHLNSCPVHINQVVEGLSVQKIVENWRHKTLLLFKMLLLRRKILVYGSPAGLVSSTVLSLVSLLPHCLQSGLSKSTNVVSSVPVAPIQIFMKEKSVDDATQFEEELSPKETGNMLEEKDILSRQSFDDSLLSDELYRLELSAVREKCHSIGEKYKPQKSIPDAQQSVTMARDMSVDGLYNLTGHIDQTECGLPLELFEGGYICLPYLSLQYLDLLTDTAVKGFVVGASNVLFKQKRQIFDVLVDLNDMRIETSDMNLRRQLTMGTEDLRFADHVVRHASTQGDAWIRDQFASYMLYLLRTSLLPDNSREIESFNTHFMNAFKSSPAYEKWYKAANSADIENLVSLAPMHPFSGHLSVADMKLKFAHTMTATEGGRKVTAAVASTGRAVASTSRAVGGALSHARGALSGWWSALTTPASAPSTASENSLEDKLDVSDAADPSDAEDVVENLQEDNNTPDPPDKVIEDQSTHDSKITII